MTVLNSGSVRNASSSLTFLSDVYIHDKLCHRLWADQGQRYTSLGEPKNNLQDPEKSHTKARKMFCQDDLERDEAPSTRKRFFSQRIFSQKSQVVDHFSDSDEF